MVEGEPKAEEQAVSSLDAAQSGSTQVIADFGAHAQPLI